MTNLSGSTLTLNNTSLTKDTLALVTSYYYVPDNCTPGTTVVLDGVECLCVATGVTIQGSSLTRIAVDKNHDLGYYQKYVGRKMTNNATISVIRYWRWGGYGYSVGNTSQEVGYGLLNTINCLANTSVYRNGSSTNNKTCPLMWKGVNDFRSAHSDKWFVPSINELVNYVSPYKSSLTFDTTTGGSSADYYWSSSEVDSNSSYLLRFAYGASYTENKYNTNYVRLCRAF